MKNLLILLGIIGLGLSSTVQAQVNKEIGLDISFGNSTISSLHNIPYSYQERFRPSFSVAIKKNILLFNDQFNIGLGLGYENTGMDLMRIDGRGRVNRQSLIVPLEIGYRTVGETYFFADLLLTPYLRLHEEQLISIWDQEDYRISNGTLGFGLQAGLQLGVGFPLTKSIDLRLSGSIKTDVLQEDIPLLNYGLNVGIRKGF